MTTVTLDNGIQAELERCITWQYDKADNIVGVINSLKDFFEKSTKKLWDDWQTDVVNIGTASDFGLAVWGKVLGVQRPVLTYGDAQHAMSITLYRKILKGRAKLLYSCGSMKDYCEYIYSIFGNKIRVIDNGSMSLTFRRMGMFTPEEGSLFTETEVSHILSEVYPGTVFVYPSGVKDNTLQDMIAFGICDTRPNDWDGTFDTNPLKRIAKLDESNAVFIWR